MTVIRENEIIRPTYSVVIPVLNEAGSLRELHRRLSEVMTGRYDPVEFVFVDDHSTDASAEILSELAELDKRVVFLRLKRNYGQTVALAAGFDHAAGDIVLSMDGDLQHDPDDIPRLIDTLLSTDADIVSGWRQKRVDNLFFRRIPSRIANWLMAKLSGVNIHDFGTTFKVYRRETIKDVRLYGELHRFIPALASLNGAKVLEVPIRNIPRPQGKSHYGLSRTFRVFFDLITIRFMLRYMLRPLHLFGPTGVICFLSGGAILLTLFVEKIVSHVQLFVQHGPLLIFGVLLCLFGLQFLAVGLVGELMMRNYFEAHQKPIYRLERLPKRKHLTEMPQ
ncbi:MAG TPA: glycosyltransferase family 2 protein [Candidatus Acidoferrales bacterium]|nr:glycosyltransferase family 2 protein [Candidatus Acidoferrales bacterium]